MSTDVLKQEFIPRYLASGDQKFYKFLITYALNKLILIHKDVYRGVTPDLEFLDYYDRFIILYRREGDDVYLQIAKIFRKAAHKIYRIMLKKDMTIPNAKFLNVI